MFKGLILEMKVCNMRYAPESSEKFKGVETSFRKKKIHLASPKPNVLTSYS